MNKSKLKVSTAKSQLGKLYKDAQSVRMHKETPQDVSLGDVYGASLYPNDPVKAKEHGMQHLMNDLGIEPNVDTVENIITTSDADSAMKWVVPEIMRDAITLGLRLSPVYPNIIASEEPINALTIQMPHINMSDAAPRYVNEGETIKTGGISYGTKELKVRKMGRGIKFTDEFKQFTTLNVLSIFMRDFGVKLGYALDGLAINVLLNGEQADGSESAPVIGVTTTGTLVYEDLLRVWVRLSRMGRSASVMVAGEANSVAIMNMDAFKKREAGTTQAKLDIKMPIPNSASLYVHGAIPNDQVVILDPANTMVKFNSRPLLIESERMVSNQTNASYATLSTGFGILFRDARIVLDKDLAFSATGFPAYMNVDLLTSSELK